MDNISENEIQSKQNNVQGKGRGTFKCNTMNNCEECICMRPYAFIVCNVCGYYTKGRVKQYCVKHPEIIFLCDVSQCPQCKAHAFMLEEFKI